ncbi:thiamine phosphate synthase [Aliagarivorans marinus]|uniref:thiamine phosphate synthase n=1 Tax=Aliagarivorans marinus TaxID=561965 RepID=UPI0004068458|nr:thiamine phosphate synthase [Aliagarivorans marinus]
MSNPFAQDTPSLYLVTDENLSLSRLCHVVEQAVKGGIGVVQLREKRGDVRAFIERAEALKSTLAGSGVPLIINDRIDVALAVDADGVHLGQTDMPAEYARKLLGPNKLLGLSVESEQQLIEAQSLPVDHLGLSAIFATPTKTNTQHHWGINGLTKAIAQSKLPLVAIGGINQGNIAEIAAAGVASIALVSAICSAEDPQCVSRELIALMSGKA